LARALYNKPRYLFLDEPNALLDGDGERALMQTLMRLKAEGTTIVMVLHRSGVMGLADKILRLEQGRIVDFGPRTEVLARLSGNRRRIVVPCLLSSLQDLRDWVASQFTRSTDEGFSQKAQLVAMELFHLAIASQMDTGQASAEIEFQLKFLNEFECELRMIGAIAPEAADKMVRIRKEIADGKVPSSKRARDEVALAALTEMSSHFSLQNQQGVTIFDVSLRSGLEGSPVTNVAGGRVN
jgi:ABC-type multidrug transport system ATPase subunit